MIGIERLHGDELLMSRYRPIPVSGLNNGQVKAMNPLEPTRGGSVTPAASSRQEIERWASATLQEQLDQKLGIRVEEHSPGQHTVGNALRVIRRLLEGGRFALRGLRAPEFAPSSIERELSGFLEQFSTTGVRCEVSVAGHPKELKPAIREQINQIGRQALANALLHSEATCIETEVEYLPHRLRVVVRDNGCGIDPQPVRTQTDAHWSIVGMRDRAESIGAKLTIWSRPGAGTEVEISVSGKAFAAACA
jgi:signal transduction histidine kinase